MPLKLKETNLLTNHDRIKNPNWRETDQLITIYKYDQLESAERHSSLVGFQLTRDLRRSGEEVKKKHYHSMHFFLPFNWPRPHNMACK